MGWFIGVRGKNSSHCASVPLLKKIVGESCVLFEYQSGNGIVVAGGLPETCYSHSDGETGWVVAGIGIQEENRGFQFMSKDSWQHTLSTSSIQPKNIQGHYAFVKWDNATLELCNDVLETRRAYFFEQEGCLFYSTRLDWLAKIKKGAKLDITQIGSYFSLMNSVHDGSIVEGIQRLGPNGYARFDGRVDHKWNHWVPGECSQQGRSIIPVLSELLPGPINENGKVYLGLSGGIDSRTVLSLLHSRNNFPFSVLTYGENGHPDVLMAQRIAREQKLDIESYLFSQDDGATAQQKMTQIALASEMTDTGVHYQMFSFLQNVYNGKNSLVDGGRGEVLRGGYGNTFILRGKHAIKNGDAQNFIRLDKKGAPSFIAQELWKKMTESTEQLMAKALNEMPSLNDISLSDWVDLYLVRYRLKNTDVNMQGFFDTVIPSYMPMLQPVLLDMRFSTKTRPGNRLFSNCISSQFNELTRYPLVRYDTYIPFWAGNSNVVSKLFGVALRKMNRCFHPQYPIALAQSIKEDVFDRVNSKLCRECELYNFPVIKRTVDEFYQGNTNHAGFIFSFLAFHSWVELLSK